MRHSIDAWNLTLIVVGGSSIPLETASITVSANSKNRATVQLAVGNWEVNNQPNSITIPRGNEAKIVVSYPGLTGSTTIFHGVIYDYAPATSIAEGRLSMTVILYGRLFFLQTGTLHTSMTVPSSYLETAGYWRTASNSTGSGNRFARISDTAAISNFGSAFIKSLQEIANGDYSPKDSVSAEIKALFGSSTNAEVAAILASIIPRSMTFRGFQNRNNTVSGIVSRLNKLIEGDWSMLSFFDRITQLGALLYFTIIEVGSKIYLVPFSPFFTSGSALAITPDTYNDISQSEDTSEALRNYRGVVLTSAPDTAPKDPTSRVVGYFNGSSGGSTFGFGSAVVHGGAYNKKGQVIVKPMPHIYVEAPNKNSTSGFEKRRCAIDVSPDLGNDLAKFMFWKQKYEGRTYYINCPYLRLDVGPLTPVRVYMPTSNEIQSSLEAGVLYGMVTSVSIQADATQGTVRTVLEVGYVRTKTDQTELIEANSPNHPVWAANWRGSTLSGNPR